MAEALDFDAHVGHKRRFFALDSEIEGDQHTFDEQPWKSVSPTFRNTFGFASESCDGLEEKVKCSSLDETKTEIALQENQEMVDWVFTSVSEGVKERQVMDASQFGFVRDIDMKANGDEEAGGIVLSSSPFVNENSKKMTKYELGFSGLQESNELKNSWSVRSSYVHTVFDEQKTLKALQMDQHFNKGLTTSYISFHGDESQLFLKDKGKLRLVEPGVELISDSETQVSKPTAFEISGAIEIEEDSEHSSRFDGDFATVKSEKSDEKVCDFQETQVLKVTGGFIKRSLKIEVIDETAVIDTACSSKVGNGRGKEKRYMGFTELSRKSGNKNVMKQEMIEKKDRRSQRKGRGKKKDPRANGKENTLTYTAKARISHEKKSDEGKRLYSMKEMKALRFVNMEVQRKKWLEAYRGLGTAVASEYDGLVEVRKHIRLNFDHPKRFAKKEGSFPILGSISACTGMLVANGRGNHLKSLCIEGWQKGICQGHYVQRIQNRSLDLYS